MPLVPLDIPAGVVRHGTDSESAGRWRDVNFVRWENGSLRPIGGWVKRQKRSGNDGAFVQDVVMPNNEKPRAAEGWLTNARTPWIAAGTHNNLYAISGGGDVYGLLPSAISGATDDAVENVGFGQYFYGRARYGITRPSTGVVSAGDTWTLDTWGENLIACNTHEGKIREWALNPLSDAIEINDDGHMPSGVTAIVVTEDRFLFALGGVTSSGANKSLVSWCDREDNTVWQPLATNEAGSFTLDTPGDIVLGLQVRGRTLILTEVDAHAATYSGPPVVFGFEKVGTGCGAISPHCAISMDAGAIWMGYGSFFYYDGQQVQAMPCEVKDYVFKGMNDEQRHKITAVKNGHYNEIWWFYPSAGSKENDSYVIYDYEEKHWNIGKLNRTCGIDAGVFRKPVWMGADSNVYDHETGYEHNYTVDGELVTAYAETGPIEAGAGDNVINVTKVIPDHKATGAYEIIFKTKNYPNDSEKSVGPFPATSQTSARFQGRQIRMRINPESKTLNRIDTDGNGTNDVFSAYSDQSSVIYSVSINGRALGDINGNGTVTDQDNLRYADYAQNQTSISAEEIAYCENVIDNYMIVNYPATKQYFDVDINREDWTLGTVRLETKIGGTR